MKKEVRPGVTTAELDAIGARVMEANGARSAPASVYGFPGSNCISLNEEAVHGVPGNRSLRAGDLLKLDGTGQKNGFMARGPGAVGGGVIKGEGQRLMACARKP